MKTVKPIGDWVLVKVIKENMFKGIIMPDSANHDQVNKKIVEAIGDKVTRLAPGDDIIFFMQSAIKVDLPDIEKDTFVLVKEEMVLGKLEDIS